MSDFDQVIGSSGTELTREMLERAITHMRTRCQVCGGSGVRISEPWEHYEARLLTAFHVRGGITLGESFAHESPCHACGGSGAVPEQGERR